MTVIDQRLEYYRQFRSQILEDLAESEAGHRRTSESITDLRHRLAKTDQIIAALGGKTPRGPYDEKRQPT